MNRKELEQSEGEKYVIKKKVEEDGEGERGREEGGGSITAGPGSGFVLALEH